MRRVDRLVVVRYGVEEAEKQPAVFACVGACVDV